MATPTSSRRYSRFQPQEVDEVQPTVSASVGHDHWANDVLKVVDKAKSCSESSASGSNSPDYSETSGTPAVVSVKAKVLEKKRKFHTGRCLELKNLPDGCVEQVGNNGFSHSKRVVMRHYSSSRGGPRCFLCCCFRTNLRPVISSSSCQLCFDHLPTSIRVLLVGTDSIHL